MDNVKTWYGEVAPCNAPFNNMYFTVTGTVSPCWKLPGVTDKWSTTRSISDIWFGEKFQLYRDSLKKCQFINRCIECKNDIDNDVWPLAKAYQKFPVQTYPSLMELELSNKCNLECIMCSGELSSGIRKNRDHLPPLPMIYNQQFVEQLREFIPHLKELRFNGGEPFAQKIVFDICKVVYELNPGLKINIATNGTIFNKNVRDLLRNNNVHINISIDSLIDKRYEEIRINGDFNKLMVNFEKFKKYSHTNNKQLSIMVNPMRNNWDEMVAFAKWTSDHNVNLWLNTILYPKHLAIWNLPSDQLQNIFNTLSTELNSLAPTAKNYSVIDHFVNNQLKSWLLDSYV